MVDQEQTLPGGKFDYPRNILAVKKRDDREIVLLGTPFFER